MVAAAEPGSWVLRVVSAHGKPAGEPHTVTDEGLAFEVARRENAARAAGVVPPVWTWLETSVPAALLLDDGEQRPLAARFGRGARTVAGVPDRAGDRLDLLIGEDLGAADGERAQVELTDPLQLLRRS